MSRGNFRSDNESGVAEPILQALTRVNAGSAHSYGEDAVTAQLNAAFNEVFEREVTVFPVVTGTAANALCVAQMVPAYGAVLCHQDSHLNVDECGAPEFYAGGAKLIGLPGGQALIAPERLARTIEASGVHGDHECELSAVSLTQSTELGTVYSTDHISEISAIARAHGLRLHMDGARFANAVASLQCSPADVSWRAGVDMLSFGASKNGAMAAEAVIVFDPSLARALGRRRKRGGHLISKMRFVSAQLLAYLQDGLWLELAANANAGARRLAAGLGRIDDVEIALPVQANGVFARLPDALAQGLKVAGFEFHGWPGEPGLYRLLVPFNMPTSQIDDFVQTAGRLAQPIAG